MEESMSVDVEAELYKILHEEIWKEIEVETGMTQEKLDQSIIERIVKIAKEKGLGKTSGS
jgi:cell division protein FtsL